jgi:Zn-dependent protease with chaperone function
LLGALAVVALANGLLLCLTLYAVLNGALRLLELPGLPLAFGVICGAASGITVLAIALRRERALRQGRYRAWRHRWSAHPLQAELEHSLARLAAANTLRAAPFLRVLEDGQPNAFAVGRSRDDAVIVVTDSLLEMLTAAERDAVLAHELAHVEKEDIKAVVRADAIAGSIGDAQSIKGRVLWGPGRVFRATWRLYLVMLLLGLVGMLTLPLIEEGSLASLLFSLAVGGALYAYGRTITAGTLYGVVQTSFLLLALGPLTVVEIALAAPTALAISRLISRDREYEADKRSTELTGGCAALISALEKLQAATSPSRPGLEEVRFALFVSAPLPGRGLRRWIACLYATHPPVARRIDALRALEARKMAPDRRQHEGPLVHGCQNPGR